MLVRSLVKLISASLMGYQNDNFSNFLTEEAKIGKLVQIGS